MASTRFEVAIHAFGRPPFEGCAGFPKHEWTRITPRPLGFAAARKLADTIPVHAVVGPWQLSGCAYDNGNSPVLPRGWFPPEAA